MTIEPIKQGQPISWSVTIHKDEVGVIFSTGQTIWFTPIAAREFINTIKQAVDVLEPPSVSSIKGPRLVVPTDPPSTPDKPS
jgi:hypothetical protein